MATGDEPLARSFAGKRVAFATGISGWGSWAEYAVAEAAACIALIDTVRDEDGAAMIVNPLTALAMFDIVRQEGEKAFIVTAGASQLGKLIITLAKEEGFRPIARWCTDPSQNPSRAMPVMPTSASFQAMSESRLLYRSAR